MDPLTAISLASNILSFIDFGAKAISGAIDIYGSSSGLTEENYSAETIAAEMQRFSSRLKINDDSLVGDDKALCALAQECDGLSKQIIELVDKVKLKDRTSKAQGLLAGIKSRWYEGDRQRLEKRLDSCRAQLAMQLTHLTSSNLNDQLNMLVTSAKEDTTKLEKLSNQITGLGRDLKILSLSNTIRPQLEPLRDISEHASNLLVRQCILKSLAFPGMYGRYQAVDDAHYKTFRWIFSQSSSDEEDDGSSDGEDDGSSDMEDDDSHDEDAGSNFESQQSPPIDARKVAAREALHSWLLEGDGIFHISGKMGSGKSTLMKYLREHESTESFLKKWAGERKLVFASFFFWKPGSVMQKSLTGLLRGLLHGVLQASPSLIPHVLPKQWREVSSTPWQAVNEVQSLDKDVRKAFLRLISDEEANRDHCFCFFIDGLDEFEGTVRDDTKSLVDQLCSWATTASGKVKLCVSSREYNVFMNAFPESKRIRLHQLTRSDMEKYVADKLVHMELGDDGETLMEAVVNNSSGMFIWVVLVIRRIREQIENGVGGKDLEQEIHALPRELEDLFAHLLDSLPKSDLLKAYQTFSILLLLGNYFYQKGDNMAVSLLALSFLDDYNKHRSPASQPTQLAPDHCTARANAALKQLNGYCRGLVELVTIRLPGQRELEYSAPHERMVCFTHRSIHEFLSTEAQKERMDSLLGDFIAIDAYTGLRLAEMSANPSIFRLWQSPGVLDLVNLRTISKVDSPPYTYLEALSAVAKKARAILDPPPSVFDPLASLVATSRPSANPIAHRSHYSWYKVAHCNTAQRLRAAGGESPQHPIYQALISGNYKYVKWKLRQYPQTDPEISLQLLLCCVVANRAARETWEGSLDIVHILIKRGLSPQVLTDIGHFAVEVSEMFDDPRSRKEGAMLTVWHHLLLACCEGRRPDQTDYLRRLGRILEIYLDNGADPVFEFSLIENGEGYRGVRLPKPANEEPDEAQPASEKDSLSSSSHSDKDKYDERGLYMKLTVGVERREFLLTYIGNERWREDLRGFYTCRVLSLPGFIKWHKFPNEKRLLQLIERNMIMIRDGEGPADETLLPGGTEASGERISSSAGAAGPASLAKTLESKLVYQDSTVFSRVSNPTNALPTQWLLLSCVMAIMVAIVVVGVRK